MCCFISDAINVLKEIQERHVTTDKNTQRSFVNMLNALARKGDVDGVNTLHENIVMRGLATPTTMLCNPLVLVHIHR